MFKLTSDIERLIDFSLEEDIDKGDITTEILIPSSLAIRGLVVSRSAGVLAGIDVARLVFHKVDKEIEFKSVVEDGEYLKSGSMIANINGPASSILIAERTAINYLQRLSGIATETARYVEAVEGYSTRILDTRKTTPGMRMLEKYAVRVGGGYNHRKGLGDGILVKDNHIEAVRQTGMGLGEIISKLRAVAPHYPRIEVEVENLTDVNEALQAGAEILLLDNMGSHDMAEAVKLVCGRAILEASGGINLNNVQTVAATGVDYISVGALTHSTRSLDMSLELDNVIQYQS